ncbi:unnamed protein product [Caenorhabditis auriculariae]|uniref:Myosin motor domain-containing protein n=1 Tax=Caenorhabditis auriculariae TaxID=2777116 RepID=A0A8S1H3Y2_9PELO|nr:unnamed protein product [Caenorhabditis auriculariae]
MDGNVTLGRGHVFPLENYKRGARVWHRHPELVWVEGRLEDDITFESREYTISFEDYPRQTVPLKAIEQLPFLCNPEILVGKDDLTALSYLHEPAVLHNLQNRFVVRQSIYTYCGIVLVAINPYADCSHLYGDEVIQVYRGVGKSVRELDPHIFAVAEEAFYDMAEFGKSQSIIVSGESGAGKTVSAKFVMSLSLLAAIMNHYNFARKRFLMAPGERNYHIFYQLCAARNNPEIKELHLGPCENYHYLSQGGDSRIPGVDDRADFEEMTKALKMLGFEEGQIMDVFRVLAGVLLMGNVHFDDGEACAGISSNSSSEIARLCSSLWQVDENLLRIWLTRREIRAVNEVVTKGLTKDDACRSRDALTKMIYAHLFSWLVDRVNAALEEVDLQKNQSSSRKRLERFIGVLDIYGFETFEINSFEQFCINYANEKLQQQFNQHVFKLEQEEYVREEIEWVRVDFHDNQPAIDLIEGHLGSICLINLLDEQCKLVRGTDKDWLSQISGNPELKRNPQLAFPRVRCDDFIVRHFAADVTYTIDGFVEKNRDTISEQLLEVIFMTKFNFLREVLGPQATAVLEAKKGAANGKRTVKKTVASQFRDSLKDLMTVLCSTRPHYVRCIKPNDGKRSFEFDPKRAIQQLRACGVLETVRISAAGFPSRMLYDEFSKRYRVLYTKERALWRDKPKKFADNACAACLEEGKYALGKTKIFLRTGQVAVLERVRLETLSASALLIQKTWRGYVARKKYENMKRSLQIIQAATRAFLAFRRIKYLQMHRAAIAIQSAVRRHQAEKRFQKIRNTVIAIQSHFRAVRVRRYVEKIRYEKSAIKIQAAFRGWMVRREQIVRCQKIVLVQCCVRRWLAKRRLRELKIEARSVGHLQKLNTGLENKIIELQIKLDAETKKSRGERERLSSTSTELKTLKAEMACLEAERLTLLEAKHRVEVLQLEVERLETECDVKEAQRGEFETRVVELRSRMDTMNAESAKQVELLKEELQALKKENEQVEESKRRLAVELSAETTRRCALETEVTAMREQLMRNVDLFESGAFSRNGSVRAPRADDQGRTSSNLSSLTSTTDFGPLATIPARPSAGSPEAQLDDVALIIRQQNMINEMRQRAEHSQRETARMKAILEASAIVESLDRKTSLRAFEINKMQDLESAYNRMKLDVERMIAEKADGGFEQMNVKCIFDRIIEENERYREESAELRAMLSSHFERQSVSGSMRRSPRPDSGHCSGADSEDGSSADLEEELCIERQCRHLKNLVDSLTQMVTNQSREIEQLRQQRSCESQAQFVSFLFFL